MYYDYTSESSCRGSRKCDERFAWCDVSRPTFSPLVRGVLFSAPLFTTPQLLVHITLCCADALLECVGPPVMVRFLFSLSCANSPLRSRVACIAACRATVAVVTSRLLSPSLHWPNASLSLRQSFWLSCIYTGWGRARARPRQPQALPGLPCGLPRRRAPQVGHGVPRSADVHRRLLQRAAGGCGGVGGRCDGRENWGGPHPVRFLSPVLLLCSLVLISVWSSYLCGCRSDWTAAVV